MTAQPAPQETPTTPSERKPLLAKIVASIWLAASILIGIGLINGAQLVTYGGDAYTGIQNAAARTTIAVGWVVIGTGVIAFVTAFRRP
jgi:hypothetical protein